MGAMDAASKTADVTGAIANGVTHRINTKLSELESAIQALDKVQHDYLDLVKRLDAIRNRMEPYWQGDSGEAYIRQLKQRRELLMKMTIVLGYISQDAVRRKNKLEQRRIWSTEISNAADKGGDVLSIIDIF